MKRSALALMPWLLAAGLPALAADDTLDARIRAQLDGDQSRACVAVVLIEGERVQRRFHCADPADAGRIGADTAFEIGSISKTMAATLLASLIADGMGSLDDRLVDWLPAGTPVPDFKGEPIRLRHLVTHTSALPRLPPVDMDAVDSANPYVTLTPAQVLASLEQVTLSAAPGSGHAYSNYGTMLLSLAMVHQTGKSLTELMKERLFAPLGMDGAHIGVLPAGLRLAQPHAGAGMPVPAWDMAPDLAGFGGVRATLEDMVHWARAQLGHAPEALQPALAMARAPLHQQRPRMGMNWLMLPLDGRDVLMHNGATGGSTSYMAVDRGAKRAVVVLSDSHWSETNGVDSFSQHLLDARLPGYRPHVRQPVPDGLLSRLTGRHVLADMAVQLDERDGQLWLLADGEEPLELHYDSAGDFHPGGMDARLSVKTAADGTVSMVWHQAGQSMPLRPVQDGAATADLQRTAEQLQAYAGTYPLMPGFALTVDHAAGQLRAQATGQGAFLLEAAGADVFLAPEYGIRILFQRDGSGKVTALVLEQGGSRRRAPRQ